MKLSLHKTMMLTLSPITTAIQFYIVIASKAIYTKATSHIANITGPIGKLTNPIPPQTQQKNLSSNGSKAILNHCGNTYPIRNRSSCKLAQQTPRKPQPALFQLLFIPPGSSPTPKIVSCGITGYPILTKISTLFYWKHKARLLRSRNLQLQKIYVII